MSHITQQVTLASLTQPLNPMIKLGVVLAAVGSVASLVPFIGIVEMSKVFINPEQGASWSEVQPILLAIASALVIAWLFTVVGFWITHLADHKMQSNLRRALVTKLGQVPLGWYNHHTSGSVRKAVQDDLDDLHHMIAHHQVELTCALALPLTGLAYLVYLHWSLALLAITSLPFYMLAYAWMMRGFAGKMQQLDQMFNRVSSAIVEFVHGIAVVKIFGQTGRAHANYKRAVDDFSKQYSGWIKPIVKVEAIASLALSVPVITLLTISLGLFLVDYFALSVLDILACILVAVSIPQSVITLNQGLSAKQKSDAAVQRINDLLASQDLPKAKHPQTPKQHQVIFHQVNFGYDSDNPILLDINLTCPAGSITALVGRSGAGKSTLAKLAARFYDVTAGSISIGGIDLRDIDNSELYKQVGFVLQDTQLLAASVADNLRLGDPSAEQEALVKAAKHACIHERIMQLPRGYDSVVGEDAIFSGGEAQRLSIARTLLADTPILILDEATAHSDAESESLVQQAISSLIRGRTVIVIAHKLHTISHVDQIAVLDRGQLVELGTHQHLLTLDGHYSRLWQDACGENPLAPTAMRANQ